MVALRGLRAAAAAAATAAVIAGGNSIMGSGQEGGFATIVVDNQGFGGGVVRMEARGGALLYENAWGTLAHGSREPLAPSTPFEIASITKMFTATAILLLIDNGTLASLSQPLSLAAPRLLLHLGDGGGGAPRHWRNVTLQQLLQHTSGLDDYWQDPAFQRAFEADEQRLWTPMELLGYAMHMSPLTTSATSSNHNSSNNNGYHYSDTNYVLLGLVVEEAAGMPLGQYFQKAIFEPLGACNGLRLFLRDQDAKCHSVKSIEAWADHVSALIHSHKHTNTPRHEQHLLQSPRAPSDPHPRAQVRGPRGPDDETAAVGGLGGWGACLHHHGPEPLRA